MHSAKKNASLQAVITLSIHYCQCLQQTQAGETVKVTYVTQTRQTIFSREGQMKEAD